MTKTTTTWTKGAQHMVRARFEGRVEMRGTTVKGRFLTPGTFTPLVDGRPAEVLYTRDVIMAAYEALKDKVDAGKVEIRLSHPDVGDMPIRFGLVREIRCDAAKGEVWLADSQPFPEMEALLTDEARERLQEMALSINGAMTIQPQVDAKGNPLEGKFVCTSLVVDHVDIVDVGAFAGSEIVAEIPATLAAKLQGVKPASPEDAVATLAKLIPLTGDAKARILQVLATAGANQRGEGNHHAQAPGGSGASTKAREANMPKIEDPSEVPQDVQDALDNDTERIAAYTAAYNQAIEEGSDPTEAHEKAMQAVTVSGEDEDEEKDMDAKALKAKLAQERGRVKALEAQLQAKDGAKVDARVKALEGRVATLQAANKKLEDERREAEAQEDVTWAITKARKAYPAEKDALLRARRLLGHTEFEAMIQARKPAIPVGERGQGTAGQDHHEEAVDIVARYGIDGVFAAGLYQVDAKLRQHLAKTAPHDPRVKKHCAAELKEVTA